jgi:hypothetical protein
LFAASFLDAQEDASDTSSGHPADLSITALVETAKGRLLGWRPDWPLSVPPDLFYAVPGSAVAVITVAFEAPKERFAEQAGGESAESGNAGKENAGRERDEEVAPGVVSVEWRNGRLARFPVFHNSSFIQAAANYNASGVLDGISAEGLEMTFLRFDEEARPLIARIRTENGYFFAALEYRPDGVTETWYDENGLPQSVLSIGKSGESVRIRYGENGAEAEARQFFFNSYGSVSEIRTPEGTWSAQYERRGFPRYLERKPKTGLERYRFQWDEAGRLTRLSGVRDGSAADSRFEYILDDRGNWILRREITMTNRSGRLFPGPGAVIRRRIQYGDRP